MDCLICNKQTIKLPKEGFKCAFFLEFAMCGFFKESITVNYMNRDIEEIEIEFDDSGAVKMGAENVVWEGTINGGAGADMQTISYAGLYARKLKLSKDAIIDCIILPEQNNIHVLAITLCK